MNRNTRSLSLVIFMAITLIGCGDQLSTSEKTSSSTTEELIENTTESIPEAEFSKCPPYYSESEEVLRLNLPSDLYGMFSEDFNDDGFPDVLILRGFNGQQKAAGMEILLNDGDGGLINGTAQIFSGSIPSSIAPRDIVLKDFNGDNRPDIFVADHGRDVLPAIGAKNSLVLSASGGQMINATDSLPDLIDFTHSATAADIDGDGDVDLFIGNVWGGTNVQPAIYLNTNGEGAFSQAKGRLPFPLEDMDFGAFSTSKFVDVNNDSSPDLILGDAGDDLTGGIESYVLLNDGTGHFSYLKNAIPPKPWSETDLALDINAADINGDGFQDIFMLFQKWDWRGRFIQILINNQDGTFRDETEKRMPQSDNNDPWLQWIQLYDLDNDGNLDVVATPSMGNKTPYFYLNDGNGNFRSLLPKTFNLEAEFFTMIDIDQNGFLDVLWAATYPNEIYYIIRSLGCPSLD